MKRITPIIIALIFAAVLVEAQTQYVNPFVGTGGHGHTFPGAIMPFGAVQLSPDTRLDGWDGCSGYHYSDKKIYGFSHTHLSGTGVEDYCDILVTPFIGTPSVNNDRYALAFSHKNETASPGYYSVKFDNGILAEMTASNYVGVHRYRFPKSSRRGIIIDLSHRDLTLESSMTQRANDIVGFRRSESWSTDQYCAFSLKTSITPSEIVYYIDDQPVNVKEISGKNCKAVLYFDDQVSEVVVKVAISAVDIDGAINNQTEIQDFDFEKVRKNADDAWNKELGKIFVESKNKEYLKTFYTALYHCFTSPYLYSDLDGRYRNPGNQIAMAEKGRKVYTVFSLWDTYRALHPLLSFIDKRRTSDFMYTFLERYRAQGYLPMWELSSFETWCMIGYHSVPVVLDAYRNGVRDFPAHEMLDAMVKTANLKKLGRPEYMRYGYVPGDMENESVSKTLEYAYDDWCIAMFAKEIGDMKVFDEFIRRAQSYRNILDDKGFMHARMNGGFVQPFDPREVNNFYTEANSWQYSTYVPHDFAGYSMMMGGKKNVENFLDNLFNSSSTMTGREQSDITGTIGQYAHGNEPSHHAAYLYNFVENPWKTQSLVKQILTKLYSSHPDGLCGNEDCGQMSAWYVFSAMGFYPVCPGSDMYAIGYPLFDKVQMRMENGSTLTVIRKGGSKPYIESATLNGKPLSRSYLTLKEIADGGTIEFTMSDTPGEKWGKGRGNYPSTEVPRRIRELPVPIFSTDKMSFRDKTEITLAMPKFMTNTSKENVRHKVVDIQREEKPIRRAEIERQPVDFNTKAEAEAHLYGGDGVGVYYTTDGSEPTPKTWRKYLRPIVVDRDMTVKAVTVVPGIGTSKIAEARYVKYSADKEISYVTNPDPQYFAGGKAGLIDNLRGTVNYRIGGWQGFTGDFEADIDLLSVKNISEVAVGFLEEQRSWIFFPRKVEILVSKDGKKYERFGEYEFEYIGKTEGAGITDAKVKGEAEARYVKVRATNFGKLPEWHISAGGQAWLFIDEISVR